jgi:AcrR family transcriptional regulator
MREKRTRKGSGKKKEDILRAVLQLFLKKGYNATSTNDICAAAKLAKPTLYYYFGSKRDLLFSLHQDHLNSTLRPYIEGAQAIEDLEQRLYHMIRGYTKMICAHPELRFLIHETLGFKDKYFLQIKKEWKNHYILLRDTISGLQAAGKVDPALKSSWAALFLIGMITWITFWLDFKRKEEIDGISDSAVAFACNALKLKPGQIPELMMEGKSTGWRAE